MNIAGYHKNVERLARTGINASGRQGLFRKATGMTDDKATTAEPRRQFAVGDRVQIAIGHRSGQMATVMFCGPHGKLYAVSVDGEKYEFGYSDFALRRA